MAEKFHQEGEPSSSLNQTQSANLREAWRYAFSVAEKLGNHPKKFLNQDRLISLRQTWRYARENSIYYSRILPDIKEEQIGLMHLREVPICTKTDLVNHYNDLRCTRSLPPYMVFTGGTTGIPRVIYGAEEDFDTPQFSYPAQSSRQNHPLGLITDGGHHGTAPQLPGRKGLIQIPLRNHKNYEWAWQMLSTEHHFEGYESKISYARLPLPAVKKLVHFFLEQNYDLSLLSLQVVGTFAWYLSNSWRRLIENTLNVVTIDYFGFTEIFSGLARECPVCGWHHYGKQVIWEVVDSWSGESVDEGIGKLLVTSLYPYTRDQILFRYESGDLVEIGPFCETIGDRGFRFCGRISQSFAIHDGQRWVWVLLPTQIQEIVDSNHWIARFEERRFSGITVSGDDAFPKWRVQQLEEDGIPILQIDLEMKASPRLFYEEWKSFEKDLRARLIDANQDLKRLVQEKKVILRIEGLPPGSIADEEVFIC